MQAWHGLPIHTNGVHMCIVFALFALSLVDSTSTDPWPPGFIGINESERMRKYDADVDAADLDIVIRSDDKVDIGITGKSFTLEELKRYFRFQKHKDFIVITYDKSAPRGSLNDSVRDLKEYFKEAGYKRILLTHSHSMGVIIREDYRPPQLQKSP